MKKYMFLLAIGSLLSISYIKVMEKKATLTNLSDKDAAKLRKAINNYKNNRSPAQAEKIINWYAKTYPNDKLVIAKMNEKARFDMGLSMGLNFEQQQAQKNQKSISESSVQDEEKSCCICMEDYNMGQIPCKNNHNELICQTCLKDIKNSTNSCPLCREPLIN